MPHPDFRPLLGQIPVVPVLTVEDPATAVPLAEALVAGGLPVIEVTLRTPAAAAAMAAMAKVKGAIVGAGTVRSQAQIDAALEAGAQFLVSPGAGERLIAAAETVPVPFLMGTQTASEAMHLAELGFPMVKFFPAEQAGGVALLKALAAPLPDIVFCPTGGIDAAKAPAYLALPNVACVGGSWVAPKTLLDLGDFAMIETLSREAAQMRHRH